MAFQVRTKTPIQGYRRSFPWVKRPGRDVDHSSPSSLKESGIPRLPLYTFKSWTGTALQFLPFKVRQTTDLFKLCDTGLKRDATRRDLITRKAVYV